MGTTYVHATGNIMADLKAATGIGLDNLADHYIDTANEIIYLAVKSKNDSGQDIVFGVVVFMRPGTTEIGFKDCDEGMGPYANMCPKSVLSKLSPVDLIFKPGTSCHKNATNWRNWQIMGSENGAYFFGTDRTLKEDQK